MSKSVIQLRSGRHFDLLNPHPEDVQIEDIAHALSNLCRFTGHCDQFYSVAQHSLLVSAIVPAEHALAGLLHDAVEAYIGDISTPLKRTLDSSFVALEDLIQCTIAEKFGYVYPFSPEIKEADVVALSTEKRDLMGGWSFHWMGGPEPSLRAASPSWPRGDYLEFMSRFDQLS